MSTIEKALDKLNIQQPLTTNADQDELAFSQSSESETFVGVNSLNNLDNPLLQARQERAGNQDIVKNLLEIDLQSLSDRNFVSVATERRLIYEEYRVIKRKIINNAFGSLGATLNNPNLILVSSSRPGEGKTFTAVNLALSIALEQDKTVLLIDSDVLRPNVSRTLQISAPIGLTDYLSRSDVQVADIMFSTNIDRLKIITAGKQHHLSTELLASDKMKELVTEFASRYPDRIVIFDAPPLLGVNETSVLAAMCGQAVVVVEENKTNLNELEKAISLLPPDLATGFVINKASRSSDKGYGYGYGYYANS